jgi:hypothetical protein
VTTPDPREIVANAFSNLYGFSSIQEIEVQSEGGHAIQARVARSAGDLDKILIRLIAPNDWRGSGVLMIETAPYAYDTRSYDSGSRRIRKVPWQRDEPMPRTDLWYEDFLPKRAADWNVGVLSEDNDRGRSCWRITITPAAAVSAYDRADLWCDREHPVILRAEFHRNGAKVRTMAIDPESIVESKGYLVPKRTTFEGNAKTVVSLGDPDIRDELPAKFFTTTALERENRP